MQDIAHYIDHTLLKPESTSAQIDNLCSEAKEFNFFSVCVNSSFVERAKKNLEGSNVKVCAVVGFPLGAMDSTSKAFETSQAIKNGADEIDMVIHIGALKEKNYDYLENDIRSVVNAAKSANPNTLVKVIIETSLLNNEEKVAACQASCRAHADFVKTSTGFGGGGATIEDIALMRKTVGPNIGVKASGGVKNLNDAQKLIAAGATRLGTSSGVAIVKGLNAGAGY